MELDLEPVPGDEPNSLTVARRKIVEWEASLLLREQSLAKERAALEELRQKVDTYDADLLVMAADAVPGRQATIGPLAHGEIKKSIMRTLERMLPNLPTFSTPQLIDAMRIVAPHVRSESNRANISMYLRELVDEGFLEVVSEGRGQTPAFFSKK